MEITKLDFKEAKDFFIDCKSYLNFDLPYYFDFSKLLEVALESMGDKELDEVCKKDIDKKIDWPKNYEDINYTFLSNKDGAFAWRPLQLIHPILYIDLVNTLTNENNWKKITERFKDFSESFVECISIPQKSIDNDSNRALQIKHWWDRIEQQSIILALEYDYVFITDITNCYGSIYTHSIDWALCKGGKSEAKINKKNNVETLGSRIDKKIMNMSYGQTNGIPQGSVLMDFIAEIVLGYADIELTNTLKLNNIKKEDFKIVRYRDDYRIFVKDPIIGKEILKHLNLVLYDFGMKMNPNKTTENDDVLLAAIKKEKLERVFSAPAVQSYQKEALRIYQLSKKYPNAGLISTELSNYYDRIENFKILKKTNIEVLVSIFSMIAFNSPREINSVSAIISLLLEKIKDAAKKEEIIKNIHKKFLRIPNSSLIDVWLQRISTPLKIDIDYRDKLTKAAVKKLDNLKIWNSEWLDGQISEKIRMVAISNLNEEIADNKISRTISRPEFELFRVNYND
jgi:hypothetical protein